MNYKEYFHNTGTKIIPLRVVFRSMDILIFTKQVDPWGNEYWHQSEMPLSKEVFEDRIKNGIYV